MISYKLIATNLCFIGNENMEAENPGNYFFPQAQNIVNHACQGTTLQFTCVKAKNKQGKIFIVQPLTVKL